MIFIACSKTTYQYYLNKFIDALNINVTQTPNGPKARLDDFYRAIIGMGALYSAKIKDPMLNALNYMRDALRSDPKHDFLDDVQVYLNMVKRKPGELYQESIKATSVTAAAFPNGRGYFHVKHTYTGAPIIAIANTIGKIHWNDIVFTCVEDSPFFANACYLQMCALGLRGSICKSNIVITGRNRLTEGLICPKDALITPNFYQMDVYADIMEDMFGSGEHG